MWLQCTDKLWLSKLIVCMFTYCGKLICEEPEISGGVGGELLLFHVLYNQTMAWYFRSVPVIPSSLIRKHYILQAGV